MHKKFIINSILILVFSINLFSQISIDNKSSNPVIHYWHFNNINDEILIDINADYSVLGNASISYQGFGGGYMDKVDDGTNLNIEENFHSANALRVRNPSNLRDLVIDVPTTGFEDITLSYAVKRTSNGQTLQTIYYSTSEVDNWSFFQSDIQINENYNLIELDFSDINEASNNPNFKVKIVFAGEGIDGELGNNRFDNMKLQGYPTEDFPTPPYFTEIPNLFYLVENQENFLINLNEIFVIDDSDEVTITIFNSNEYITEVSIEDNILNINPLRKGDSYISLYVNSLVFPVIPIQIRVIVLPEAHNLAEENFSFNQWQPTEPDYSYPENMLFLQSNMEDPELKDELLFPYFIPHDDYNDDDLSTIGYPYNNTRRTRINALGNNGISFINTGRDRDLGGALLCLNTTNIDDVFLSFIAGTVLRNERLYGLRLMYRTSIEDNFDNLMIDGSEIDYIAQYNGHYSNLSIKLPEELIGHEYLQLLWKYYYVDGNSGSRAEIRLDNIIVSSENISVEQISEIKINIYPNPAKDFININIPSNNDNTKITLTNNLGQILREFYVSNEKSVQLNTKNLNNGLYFINFIFDNNIYNEKLIIHK